jgi:hypothetical protein
MTIKAEKAAEKTRRRGCRIAMRAATRNVLSPISEKMIIVKDRINEWNGWITPPASSSNERVVGVFGLELVSSGFLSARESGTGCGMSWGLLGRSVGFCKNGQRAARSWDLVAAHLEASRTVHSRGGAGNSL